MASIPSNYELNVARAEGRNWNNSGPKYVHFCRIELGTGMPEQMEAKAAAIAARFPSPEFQCTLTYWECIGQRKPL